MTTTTAPTANTEPMTHTILVRFHWSLRRHGDIEQVFETTAKRLSEYPGLPVYFGECAGKHSEVYGRLKAEDFTVLAASADEIGTVKKVLGDLPADVDVEEAIERAIESFAAHNIDPDEDAAAALASVLMPGEPGYEERAAREVEREKHRCPECRKLSREGGGGTYSHEARCSNPDNRAPKWP